MFSVSHLFPGGGLSMVNVNDGTLVLPYRNTLQGRSNVLPLARAAKQIGRYGVLVKVGDNLTF
jgi:hypothetical protein